MGVFSLPAGKCEDCGRILRRNEGKEFRGDRLCDECHAKKRDDTMVTDLYREILPTDD